MTQMSLAVSHDFQHTLPARMPKNLREEFRSSHAGEMGAVWIYRGILLGSADPVVRAFAKEHIETEKAHLALFEELIHFYRGSFLLPLWICAGLIAGFLPALFGRRAVYGTIEAVEKFVSKHYREQIVMVRAEAEWSPLEGVLQACLDDEDRHREDAASRLKGRSQAMRIWSSLLTFGSNAAVRISKKL